MRRKQFLSMILAASMVLGLTACGSAQNAEEGSSASGESVQQQETVTEAAEPQPKENASAVDITAPDVPDVSGSEETATFRICTYYGGDSTVFADFAAAQIQKKFPNVTLEFETLPSDGGQTIKTRAATGDLPDILLVDSGTIDTLAESGSIVSIDEYVTKFNIANYYTDAIMENCLYSPDGKVYQFPMGSISPILWYYNKQMFEDNGIKVPGNYEELLQTVTSFQEKDIIPMAMFGKEPWPLGAFFDTFALKENPGGGFALSKGEARASDEGYQKAIQKMSELISAGIFQDGATNTDFDTASALFKEEQCAMFLNGSWYTGEAVESMGDKLGIITYYPTADAGSETQNQWAMTGGGDTSGMAVTASAENKELAAAVAFLFSYYREVAQYEMKSLVTTPLKTDNLVLENELDAVSAELLEVVGNYSYDTKFLHTYPNTKFATSFTEEMQKFLVGESIEDFTANIDKSIEKTVE